MNSILSTQIERIEFGLVEGKRPRKAGCNARLGIHGDTLHIPVIRLTTQDGSSGFGASWAKPEQARFLLGKPISELYDPTQGVNPDWQSFEYPIWDMIGQRSKKPVFALAASVVGKTAPASLQVACYDTSLYIDDLHLDSTSEAAEFIAQEACQGYERGHRAFKIKVGRGARHLPLWEGIQRDIAVIHKVREAVGNQAVLMIDANNGYNFNIAREVLQETADCHLYWIEEAFHEDQVLYQLMKDWLAENNMNVFVADGEGEASTHLLEWAHQGLVDVIQYDILGFGLTRWLQTGRQLDAWGVYSAPHHYGSLYGNYATCHLAGSLEFFSMVEWDEASTPSIDASAYIIEAGQVKVPSLPGFGLMLVEEEFQRLVKNEGWVMDLTA